MRCANPFAFRPGPVTFWTVFVYVALLVPLLYVHETVPAAPPTPDHVPSEFRGVNISEAWSDLLALTGAFHPYNSHKNDDARLFLLGRVKEILEDNLVEYTVDKSGGVIRPDIWDSGSGANHDHLDAATAFDDKGDEGIRVLARRSSGPAVTVFDDRISNVTTVAKRNMFGKPLERGEGAYYEGDNIIVYIRGTQDMDDEWWTRPAKSYGHGGVLVNAHFDSVSTSYGATDDGMAVVTVLQLLRWFTMPGHQPKRGVVLLFNNDEEDGLWGAKAFGYSPLQPFCHTFINLEGAGAGGRALLFRTTDLQVTKAYARSPHPFGSVVAADAFAMGAIGSQTDYIMWRDYFGQRGIDIAFYAPRSLYHTAEDDARHASRDSLYHMLSAALSTAVGMAGDVSGTYAGPRPDGDRQKVQNGRGTAAVWFDLFGSGFAVFGLRSVLFAWSLALLVASPIALMVVTVVLVRRDKYYFFAQDIFLHDHAMDKPVALGGWKGLLRFPLALVVSALLVVGSVLLLKKSNPLIVASSSYAVWTMTLSLFYFSFWCAMKVASFARPSALHRGYTHIWLFVLGWSLLVVATVFEDRFAIASGYLIVFLHSAIFVSTLITLLDMFSLPAKHVFANDTHDAHQIRDQMDAGSRPDPVSAPSLGGSGSAGESDEDDADTEPDERTPLRGGGEIGHSEGGGGLRTTFATTYRRSISALMEDSSGPAGWRGGRPFDKEQNWSVRMSSATWLPQFLILAVVPVILFGQIGMFTTTALASLGQDGGNVLVVYLLVALLSVILVLPITPFIHRVTHHVPVFLLALFIATLSYNLAAFPFSASSPYKAFFQQTIDLDAGTSSVTLTGLETFVRQIMSEIPSAAGQEIECEPENNGGRRLTKCAYDGANVLPRPAGKDVPLSELVTVSGTRPEPGASRATLEIDAVNTKMCLLTFPRAVTSFFVHGSAGRDARFYQPHDEGIGTVKLFRRDRSTPWKVDIKWSDRDEGARAVEGAVGYAAEYVAELAAEHAAENAVVEEVAGGGELKARPRHRRKGAPAAAGFEVEVACLWDDLNESGAIPAFDEAFKYRPKWSILSKSTLGLVAGRKKLVV